MLLFLITKIILAATTAITTMITRTITAITVVLELVCLFPPRLPASFFWSTDIIFSDLKTSDCVNLLLLVNKEECVNYALGVGGSFILSIK